MKVLGAFEIVSFPELGVKNTIAKIDSGAYSGAVHATGVVEKKNKKGEDVLVFHPFGNPVIRVRTKQYERKRVRSSSGHLEERFVVRTTVVIDNQTYNIEISLTDRGTMMKGVLIGRKFLRQYHFFVDVRKGKQYRYAVKEKR